MSCPKPRGPVYRVLLTPNDPVDAGRRLGRILKSLLRAHNWTCLGVMLEPDPTPAAALAEPTPIEERD